MPRATILHVEDDPNDVLLFQNACRKAGLNIDLQTVADGEEALAYLRGTAQFQNRAQHPFPTLLVLDLRLPRLNGFDLLGCLRQDTASRRLPVIVLSSSNLEDDVKRAYDLGANSFLVKPVAFEGLVKCAENIRDYWLGLNRAPS